MPSLRIVTLNCLYLQRQRSRLRMIGPLLRELGADVICLQEIFLPRNVALLTHAQPLWRPWGPFIAGGLVTLVEDALDGVDYARFRRGVWFEWGARKGFLTAIVKAGGWRATVINTHLAANYDENWSIDNRYARIQLDELDQLEEAVGAAPDDQLLVVAGDFNVPAQSQQFVDFMRRTGLTAAFGWDNPESGARGGQGIDNVLYRAPAGSIVKAGATLALEQKVEVGPGRLVYPSDHFAVVADLQW